MKYLKVKAYKIMKLLVEWEVYRLILKYCIRNQFCPSPLRQFAILELASLPLGSSIVHLKLRCFFSNQSRSLLTFFKLNRMRFKVTLSAGLMNGVKKSA